MSGNAHANRDPLPPETWREASSADVRAWALERTRMAVAASKAARTPDEDHTPTDAGSAGSAGDGYRTHTEENR